MFIPNSPPPLLFVNVGILPTVGSPLPLGVGAEKHVLNPRTVALAEGLEACAAAHSFTGRRERLIGLVGDSSKFATARPRSAAWVLDGNDQDCEVVDQICTMAMVRAYYRRRRFLSGAIQLKRGAPFGGVEV